ncbi:MAG: hypothetical protein QW227_01675 [Candidatus Aenigmatarchaeota archaeon]
MLKDLINEKKMCLKQLREIEQRIQNELKKELEAVIDSDSFYRRFMTAYFDDTNRGIILATLIRGAHIKDKAVKKDLLKISSRLLFEDIPKMIGEAKLNQAYTALHMLKDLLQKLKLDDLAVDVEDLAEDIPYTTPEGVEELFDEIAEKFYKIVPERDVKISVLKF